MPPDRFALFEESRRPWIDPEPLRAKFLRLSAEYHPDRVHDQGPTEQQQAAQRYAELNAAYQCLREPKERLAHLLELETGRKPAGIEQVPADMMDLFMEIGGTNQELSRFLAEKANLSGPLLKAQWFQKALEKAVHVQALLQTLARRRTQLEERLQQLNEQWSVAPPIDDAARATRLPLLELEQSYRLLSYLNRWTTQLQEQLLQLTL